MIRRLSVGILLVVALAVGSVPLTSGPAAQADATSDNVVLQWDQAALQAIRDTRPPPTAAARALAVVHTAIYDAWAVYDPLAVGTRLGADLRQPVTDRTQANKEKATSFAYAALVDLFPTQQPAFDQQMTALGQSATSDRSGGRRDELRRCCRVAPCSCLGPRPPVGTRLGIHKDRSRGV